MSRNSHGYLDRIALKTKIVFVLTGLLLVMAGALGYIIVQLKQQMPSIHQAQLQARVVSEHAVPLIVAIKEVEFDVAQVQQWLTDISATRGMDGLDDGYKEAQIYADKFTTDLAAAKRHAEALNLTDIIAKLQQVADRFGPYYETGKRMAASYIQEGPAAGNKLMAEFDAVASAIGTAVGEFETAGMQAAIGRLGDLSGSTAHAETINRAVLLQAMIVATLSLVLVLIGAGYLFETVRRNFCKIQRDVGIVSNNDFSTPLLVQANRGDEFGRLAAALTQFRDRLRDAHDAERQKQEEQHQRELRLQQRQRMLEEFSSNIATIVDSLTSSSTALNATAGALASTADETKTKVGTVSQTAGAVSTNVQSSAAATEELTKSIEEIGERVSQAADAAGDAVAKVGATTEQVQSLARTATNINEVIRLISDIADQTNLLALNATIESARAGEAGRGFAVVANEVKQLAAQTAKATVEIVEQIEEIQQATNHAARSMDEIGLVIARVSEISTAIAAAVEQQGAATQEIARNVNEAASGTRDVSHNIAGVSEASARVGSASSELSTSAGDLARQATALKSEVGRFIEGVRAA